MSQNYHHVIMGLYKPTRCQMWPYELRQCIMPAGLQQEQVIEVIIAEVCKAHNVTYQQLRTKTRFRHIVKARQIAMYFLKKYTKLSLTLIGELFGGFDHTTVIHSENTVNNLAASYPEYREELTQLQTKIKYRI